MKFLKNHPFAVEAFFESSLVMTFAVSKEQLQSLIPPRFELDTFKDKWAFLAIAMVQTKDLRPAGFPKFFGTNFFLIGYRIFVTYRTKAGRRLRGLFIIKSETDKKKMELLGNIFTHYSYSTTDINQSHHGIFKTISSAKSKFKLVIEQTKSEVIIPEESPFSNWKDARKFSGPLPYTFKYNDEDNSILIIEGKRQNWSPMPVKIRSYEFSFLNSLKLQDMVLANAFEVRNIPYTWKKGIIERWN